MDGCDKRMGFSDKIFEHFPRVFTVNGLAVGFAAYDSHGVSSNNERFMVLGQTVDARMIGNFSGFRNSLLFSTSFSFTRSIRAV